MLDSQWIQGIQLIRAAFREGRDVDALEEGLSMMEDSAQRAMENLNEELRFLTLLFPSEWKEEE